MVKFKNKKTKQIIEENLIFYIEKLKNNPNFEEVKEKKTETIPKSEKIEIQEVAEEPSN